MLKEKLKLAAWLLNSIVLLLTLVVGTLAFILMTDKEALLDQEKEGCATINEEPLVCFNIPEEVTKNETGRALYQTNCTPCHDFYSTVVGPPLAGIQNRHSIKWIHAFIRNSAEMIDRKDSAAVSVYQLYAKQQMPAFAFSQAELDSLYDYVAAQPIQ
ncbi:c-type cytochrome [Rufibacter radiotolerans]|uniref:c-type cytochrome n=1 Tax=Rufibacter radiotolerans TaxID=1379910 RepID=UPI00066451C6|nr:cytochrome c [Rufibacter radiotolerans]